MHCERKESRGGKKGTVPICAKHPPGRSGKWGLSPFSPWNGALWLILLALAAHAGCHNGPGPGSCNDITPGAIPQPNGTYTCQWIHEEAARANQDNFVIYEYEWDADGMKLTTFGQQHVARSLKGLSSALSGRDRALRRPARERVSANGGPGRAGVLPRPDHPRPRDSRPLGGRRALWPRGPRSCRRHAR